MSEAKFTKGEWVASCVRVDGMEVKNGWGVEINGFTLAAVYTGPTFGVVHEQQKANSHLIAAAPEMYEMLEDAADMLFQSGEAEFRAHGMEIRKLLAKARGESC